MCFSCRVIKDKKVEETTRSLRFVDERLLNTPPIALMQVKKEMDYMFDLVEENIHKAFETMETGDLVKGNDIAENETIIDFTNGALTKFLINLSANLEQSDEQVIGSYFHVLNDLERIGDHAENFYEIVVEMNKKGISFSPIAQKDMGEMRQTVIEMLVVAKDAFDNLNRDRLPELAAMEEGMDGKKKELTANHYARLTEGNCSMEVSPYYNSTVAGLERVSDHLVNVGFSIVNPVGSQR